MEAYLDWLFTGGSHWQPAEVQPLACCLCCCSVDTDTFTYFHKHQQIIKVFSTLCGSVMSWISHHCLLMCCLGCSLGLHDKRSVCPEALFIFQMFLNALTVSRRLVRNDASITQRSYESWQAFTQCTPQCLKQSTCYILVHILAEHLFIHSGGRITKNCVRYSIL